MTPTPDSTLPDERRSKADLQREVAELRRMLDERTAERDKALEQQSATAEVLQVINSSPGDLTPVFDAMLERATRLSDATFGILWTYDDERYKAVSFRNVPPAYAEFLREAVRADPLTALGRVAQGQAVAHIPDIATDEYFQAGGELVRQGLSLGRFRTVLAVPMRKDETLLGAITIYRQEPFPFSDNQIALLQSFAAQAVIAVENARLITETREALEQQTATAEVLGVINSSPGDLAPVFDAILEKAHSLCGVATGALSLTDGGVARTMAIRGAPRAYAAAMGQPFRPPPESPIARIMQGAPFVQIPDMAELARENPDDSRGQAVAAAGLRTSLFLPLRREGEMIGYITAYRREVRPFASKEIALLQNFAAQAVIAMENARLITETREALEQQTATAEVLGVINASPGDLQPVVDAMVERAMRLCEAAHAVVRTFDNGFLYLVAASGAQPAYERPQLLGPVPLAGLFEPFGRGEAIVHIADVRESATYRDIPEARERLDLRGIRTWLAVALSKENTLLGTMIVSRQEVRLFTDKQIALLQNFAAQAVIAMENARLITETREALKQQTAVAEVLKVISNSTVDLPLVLETLVGTAVRLCDADHGYLFRLQGGRHNLAASFGLEPEFKEFMIRNPFAVDHGTLSGRVALEHRVVHIEDAASDPDYTWTEAQRRGNLRTGLGVPLLRENAVIGIVVLYRCHVERFTDQQIALVTTFADQAVIAIENARLLSELRDRQAELRVTFDNMVDGVAMFDQTLRLAAWNRNFQDLLQLPEEFLAARPGFDEYIRYLTERGEFGERDPAAEIARLRSRLTDHYSFERMRPDGTVIEVRNNPMPDGGTVLIYSDITERKRSEVEIKAARDAAEAAYRDLKAAQANLVQAQKMAALGQLTAGIAHEIKNPLNFVNNFAGLSIELLDELKESATPAIELLEGDKRAEIDEAMVMLTGNLEKIAEHGKRADNIVKSMLEHSRGVSGERRAVDLNLLIDEALNLAYHGARAQDQSFNIEFAKDYGDHLRQIELAPQEITRVFLNLFGNGFYAANTRARENGDGSFRPVLAVTTRDLGDAVEVRVRDNGIGIAPEIRDRLFQPFVTTKPTGEGTGLGLSISYDIVTQQHGGTITVESEHGAFTEFIIRLPRH